MKRWAAIFFVLLAACMTITTPPQPHDSLRKIGDDAWKYWLDRDISLRMKFGLPIEHLPDITFAEAQRDADFAGTILKRLDAVQPANEEERLTAAILRSSSQRSIDAVPLFWFRFPVTPYRTPLFAVHNALTRMKLDTADAVRRYDRLLDEMPRFANDTLDILREQERRGIRLPKDEIATVRGMLASFDKLPDQSPFALNEARLAQFEPRQRERAISATRDRIAQAVNPAIEHLLAHFDDPPGSASDNTPAARRRIAPLSARRRRRASRPRRSTSWGCARSRASIASSTPSARRSASAARSRSSAAF